LKYSLKGVSRRKQIGCRIDLNEMKSDFSGLGLRADVTDDILVGSSWNWLAMVITAHFSSSKGDVLDLVATASSICWRRTVMQSEWVASAAVASQDR